MNIGIHLFDLLVWLFGEPEHSELHLRADNKMAGYVNLQRARVRWFLSTDAGDLPTECRENGKFAHRSITMDGEELEFSTGFTDLHSEVYRAVLAGRGARISDARPAIELVHRINHSDVVAHSTTRHPALATTTTFPTTRDKAA